MVPRDDAAARKANETAGQWVAQVLQPEGDEVVGVIVLWPDNKSRAAAAAPSRAIFVLVKAQQTGGVYALRQITFGDPLESPN